MLQESCVKGERMNRVVEHNLFSIEDTISAGFGIGSRLVGPQCILLMGDLGAGKTTLAKGIAKGLGIQEEITSPTFPIMNAYNSGRLPLYHFDLYRLESIFELEDIGFYEYISKGISIVEWGEKFLAEMPNNAITIKLIPISEDERAMCISAHEKTRDELLHWGGLI